MDAITPSPEDGLISLSEFQRIETGMTYREVTRIIGWAGRVFTETTSGGYTMSVYTYAGEGAPSANANVTFVNGKVITKIQYGLQ